MRFTISSILPLFSVVAVAATAVAADIRGNISDVTGQPMPDATVRLLSSRDSSFVKGVIANEKGNYTFSGIKNGRYIVEATYLGYNKGFVNVDVDGANVTADTLRLHDSSIQLREAVVTGIKTPVKVMEDTVEFNADSYKTKPNAVVEDLLKRLPGVEVDTDGKITANGKQVTKILVDGKEFFSDDPKVASKNLPVDMVDKLQVVDRKSDLARMTGVDDGEEETVINLTVKKGMKNGWFGTVEAGYGTDSRYSGAFNISRFWDGNQITFIGNANNTNQLGFTDGNGNRFRQYGGSNGINNSQTFGVNFNVGKEEILRVGGDVMYSHTDRNTRQRQNREYLLNADQFFSNSLSTANDRGHNVRADFRIEWKPDSFNSFDFSPNVSVNMNDSYSNSFSIQRPNNNTTTSLNLNNSNGKSFETGGRLVYNHNFKSHKGRSFSIFTRYNFNNVNEESDAYSYNVTKKWVEAAREAEELLDTYGDDFKIYDRYTDNHTWGRQLGGRLTWTEPLGNVKNGNFITVGYQLGYRWNNADKMVYERPVNLDDIVATNSYELAGTEHTIPVFAVDALNKTLDENLSNRFRNDFFNQEMRLGYKKVSRDVNFEGGIAVTPSMSRSINLINDAKTIPTRWVWNYAPFMRFRYKMSKTKSFNANYRGRSSQPSMSQLQPVADETNPMRVIKGNPNLLPTFSHNMELRFQNFNAERQQSIMAMANVSFNQNSIVSKTTYNTETGAQFTTYENVNGVWNARAMNMFSMPLGLKTLTINNHLFLNYNQGVGFNNGLRNTSRSVMAAEMFMIAWRPENLSLEIRPNYSLQRTFNTLQTTSTNNLTVHNYGVGFNANYYLPFGLSFDSDLNFRGTKGYAAGYDTNTWMWNASVSYQFLAQKQATISLKVYDLLQQRQQISRNVTANYIDDIEYNTLTRYFMLSFTYKFNTFGKGKQPGADSEAGPWGGHGPGGPGGGHGGRRGGF